MDENDLPRLLTFNCHEAWVRQLEYVGYHIDIIDGLPDRYCCQWDLGVRPLHRNSALINLDRILEARPAYDCIISFPGIRRERPVEMDPTKSPRCLFCPPRTYSRRKIGPPGQRGKVPKTGYDFSWLYDPSGNRWGFAGFGRNHEDPESPAKPGTRERG
jgi:hypothetical protein